jgi:NAD(P)-dependent dehydrogenase (short-subunit alcohol dehydrogenase family)
VLLVDHSEGPAGRDGVAFCALDLAAPDTGARAAGKAAERFGAIDMLVAAASAMDSAPIVQCSAGMWDQAAAVTCACRSC